MRVVGAMPCRVVEIDDVDGRHAGREKFEVVVLDGGGFADELRAAQPGGASPDDVGQPGRRVRLAHDAQVAIADHVDQHERGNRLEGAGGPGRLDVVAAAVGVVVAAPFADRLFAVEEQQLDVHRQRARLEHARQLDQQRRAGAAVVGADERELLEQLGVVVPRRRSAGAAAPGTAHRAAACRESPQSG